MDDALRVLAQRYRDNRDALDASEMMALIDGLLAEVRGLEAELDGLTQGIAG